LNTARKLHLPETWREWPCDVLVLGCGGTGSEIVDALVRLDVVLRAIGHPGLKLHLQDGDTVSPSNVGRQRFLPCDVGQNKASVLAQRYGFLLGTDVHERTDFLSDRDQGRMRTFEPFDLVITAVDRASVRTHIAGAGKRQNSGPLWLDCGNGAHTGQVVLGHLAGLEDDRLPHVLDLFPGIRTTPDDDEPSCSVAESIRRQNLGVNRFMADVAVFTILAPLFTKGMIETHGALIDMAKPQVSPIRIDPQAWSFFGYAPPVSAEPGKSGAA
jgi:PRTRC genetic system ThiF family protein